MTNPTIELDAAAAFLFADRQPDKQFVIGKRRLSEFQTLTKVNRSAPGQTVGDGRRYPARQEHSVRNPIAKPRPAGKGRIQVQRIVIATRLGEGINVRATQLTANLHALSNLQFLVAEGLRCRVLTLRVSRYRVIHRIRLMVAKSPSLPRPQRFAGILFP